MLVNITPFTRMSKAPPGFHMLAKPTGAACNLDCKYCFFLSKDMLYPKDPLRMSDEMLEVYIKQTPVTAAAERNSNDATARWPQINCVAKRAPRSESEN